MSKQFDRDFDYRDSQVMAPSESPKKKDKEVVIPSINNDNWTSDYAGRATLTPEDYLKQKENIYR